RSIVRELPFQHSRLEPSIRSVLHAVTGDTNMRRLSFISLILLVGAAASPHRVLAQAGTQPPAQPAATAPDSESRSLFALTDREFLIGGRATSIDGDPARFQRYQDLRDGLLF